MDETDMKAIDSIGSTGSAGSTTSISASKPRQRLQRILRLFTASSPAAAPTTDAFEQDPDPQSLEGETSKSPETGTTPSTSAQENPESEDVREQDTEHTTETGVPSSPSSSWPSWSGPTTVAAATAPQEDDPSKASRSSASASVAGAASSPSAGEEQVENAQPASASTSSSFVEVIQAPTDLFVAKTSSELDRLLELVRLLAKTRPTPNVILKLLEGTQDEAWTVRKLALQGLGCLKHFEKLDDSTSDAAGKRILRGLADGHWEVRESAARALSFFGSAVGSSADVSEALGSEESWAVRVAILQACARLGGASLAQLDAIVNSLSDQHWKVRMWAATAIGSLGYQALSAIPACKGACKDLEWQVRRAALNALTALSVSSPESAEAALLDGLDDRSWQVRQAAAWNITQLPTIRSSKVAATLARRLTDQEELVAIASAHALGSMGAAAAAHFAAIQKLLQHQKRALREAAKRALWQAVGCDMAAAAAAASCGKLPGHFNEVTETWRRRVDPATKSFTKQLGSASEELRSEAERALFGLGLLAVQTLVQDVIATSVTKFEERMRLMRALSCTGYLPATLACSFLAEWIYTPVLDQMPLRGLELLVLQKPLPREGFNLQWALLKNDEGDCYLTFRGSETGLDWLENGNISLRRVHLADLGTFLVHGGYWSSVEGESSRILAALTKAARNRPIRKLYLTGGSKGGANAMAAAIWLLFHRHEADTLFHELSVIVFGTPNIVGKGDHNDADKYAWKRVREKMRQLAPSSCSWVFPIDPVVGIAGRSAKEVTGFYAKSAEFVIGVFKWWSPTGYNKIAGYVGHVTEVSSTLEPVIPLEELSLDAKRGGDQYDASVHPQVNYTEALCRRWISDGLAPRQI